MSKHTGSIPLALADFDALLVEQYGTGYPDAVRGQALVRAALQEYAELTAAPTPEQPAECPHDSRLVMCAPVAGRFGSVMRCSLCGEHLTLGDVAEMIARRRVYGEGKP